MNLNGNFLTIYFNVVEELHCVLRLGGASELNERITFGLLSDVVPRDFDVVDSADVLKIFTNMRFINMLHLTVIDESLDANLAVSLLLRGHAAVACTAAVCGSRWP